MRLPALPAALVVAAAGVCAALSTQADAPRARARSSLSILEYGPRGAVTDGPPQLKVRFDRPVVLLGDEPMLDAGTLFRVTPPVPGKSVWVAPDLVVFRPDHDLPDATAFEVTLVTPIRGAGDRVFDAPLRWRFETQRPSCADNADRARVLPSEAIVIECTQPLARGTELGRWVKARVDGREWPILVTRASDDPARLRNDRDRLRSGSKSDNVLLVQPRREWPSAAEVVIELSPELRGTSGPLPVGRTIRASTWVVPALTIMDVRCREAGAPLEIITPNRIETNQVRRIGIQPSPGDDIAVSRVSLLDALEDDGPRPRPWVATAGKTTANVEYQVTIPAGLTDIFGQRLGTDIKRRVTCPPPRPRVALRSSSGVLEAEKPATIGVGAVGTTRARIRAVVLDDELLRSRGPTLSWGWSFAADMAGAFWRGVYVPDAVRSETPLPSITPFALSQIGRVIERSLDLDNPGKDGWASASLDLRTLSHGRRRPVLIEVLPDPPLPRAARGSDVVRALYQVSDLGLLSWAHSAGTTVAALRYSTGRPAAGVVLEQVATTAKIRPLGQSDARGLIRIGPAGLLRSDHGSLLVARTAAARDLAVVEVDRVADHDEDLFGRARLPAVTGLLVLDRDLYRPGERVRFVGWAARTTSARVLGLEPVPAGTAVHVRLTKGGATVSETLTSVDENGKLWGEIPLPTTDAAGSYQLTAELGLPIPARPGDAERLGSREGDDVPEATRALAPAAFEVAAFRPSETDLHAEPLNPDVVAGEPAVIQIRARHRYGGASPITGVDATVSCPRLPDHVWQAEWAHVPSLGPAWTVGAFDSEAEYLARTRKFAVALTEQAAAGQARFSVAMRPPERWRAANCQAALSVKDHARRTETTSTSFRLHPTSFYLAVKQPPEPVSAGGSLRLAVQAFDTRRQRIALSRVSATLVSVAEGEERVLRRARLMLAKAGRPATVRWTGLPESVYEVRVEATDAGGRRVRTSFLVTVEPHPDPKHDPALDDDLVIVDAPKTADVGDHVRVRVKGPQAAASGMVVVIHNGVREVRPLDLSTGAGLVELTIRDEWIPSFELQALAIYPSRSRPARLLEKTALVEVRPDHRRLQVRIDAPHEGAPGQAIDLRLVVSDAEHRPAPRTRIAVWVTDEGVLALTRYRAPDPLPHFVREATRTRFSETFSDIRQPFLRGQDFGLDGTGSGGGSTEEGTIGLGGLGGLGTINLDEPRARFETTPLFVGDLATDEAGTGRVRFTLPHNLTTYRLSAIASAPPAGTPAGPPTRFGTASADLRVTLPFLLRPVAPRFTRVGDQADLVVVAHNRSERAGRVQVELAASPAGGPLAAPNEAGRGLSPVLAAGAEHRFVFRVSPRAVGEATLAWRGRLLTLTGGTVATDAISLPLSVLPETPPLEEVAFAHTLAAGEELSMPVKLPAKAAQRPGELRVVIAPTSFAAAEGAVRALVDYRHGCLEQTASRLVPLFAWRALSEQVAGGRSVGELAQGRLQRLVELVAPKQSGFVAWPQAPSASLFGTAWVTLVLAQAREAVSTHTAHLVATGVSALAPFLAAETARDPAPQRVAVELRAWAALASAEAGHPASPELLTELFRAAPTLPVPGMAIVSMALAASAHNGAETRARTVLDMISERALERATTAHVDSSAELPGFPLASPTLSDALALWAFARQWPEHPLTSKLARGLLEHRSGASWGTTFEDAVVLLALAALTGRDAPAHRDLRVAFSAGPNVTAEPHWRGADVRPWEKVLPFPTLAPSFPDGTMTLRARASGAGFGSVAVTASYPAADAAHSGDRGLQVQTTFRTERSALVFPGPVLVGSLVAMDVALTARAAVEQVALEVPLPAGFEAVGLHKGAEAALVRRLIAPHAGLAPTHEELEEDRVVRFFDVLPRGTHHQTIYVRAMVPGRFVLPGASAQAMYAPEVRGWDRRREIVVDAGDETP